MGTPQDHSLLKWIRAEIDELIVQARKELESYIEGPGTEEHGEKCIDIIQKINKTLQLVQLFGGVQLTEELELVVSAIRDDRVSNREDAAEVAMLGMIQLSEYLEKIEAGVQDHPLILLPTLNELRAVRDAEILSEMAFFSPELEKDFISESITDNINPDLPKIASEIHQEFHKGLLEWFRKTDEQGGLDKIETVLHQLSEAAGTDQVTQLFEVGSAVVCALKDGGIEASSAIRKLLSRVDNEVKRIIAHGEQTVAETQNKDLLKNLLYFVAYADSQNQQVQVVQREFSLQEYITDQKEALLAREGLHAPGRTLLEAVQGAINTDLVQVKDGLDPFIHSKSEYLERLHVLESPLRKLADTLGMVGMGNLRQKLARQADQIANIVQSGEFPDEQDMMSLAGDILYIETSLENLPHYHRAGVSSQDRNSALPEGESEKLLESVIREAQVEIKKSKDAVSSYIDLPENFALLDPIIEQFRSIAGAFKMLGLKEPAEIMTGLSDYASNGLLKQEKLPPVEDLNSFADAVTSIEYYMESISEGLGINTKILEVAQHALEKLGAAPAETADTGGSPIEAPEISEVEVPEVHDTEASEIYEDEAPEIPEEPVETAPVELGFETEPEPVVEESQLEEIDPEILEIFLEEAREEIEVIREYLPQWRANQENQVALATFRRSFHTLKGSGRLVGADTIGELAWSAENLLNRIIDETIEVSPEILTSLDEIVDVLPDLIDSQEAGEYPKVDVAPLMERAFVLANPAPAETNDDVGFAAGKITGDTSPGGLSRYLLLGILGSVLGGYLLSLAGVSGTGGIIGTFVVALLGALLFIWIIRKFRA